ncbi:hypothetical protein Bca52824_005452 [Brassica carinata]|uniref:AT5G11810-like protein n=1 Tax=Brassica carinata TaxID=52824 RepID=A0A8X8BHI4_BRACI|nr:hypothetical protein Bca52824_005452 [Brassica carinata]
MADKPSRALVLYGDGLARFVDSSNTHIHSLASVASCGFLSLPHAPPETEKERIVREFSHLLDASEAYSIASGFNAKGSEHQISTLAQRFMGLKAALVTDSSTVSSFGKLIGLDVLHLSEICQKSDSLPSDTAASEFLRLLGFEGGKCLDVSLYDSVFVHIGVDNMAMLDSLIGSIMKMAHSGSEIAPRLHLSLVLGYGSVTDKDVSVLLSRLHKKVLTPRLQGLSRVRATPCEVKRHVMMFAQWQDGVTRKDLVDTLSFEALKKLSGNLVIPADRFIHEVAFKLWKAPKYGA